MYTVKTFDYYNNEIQEWTTNFKHFCAADVYAILSSKRIAINKGYTIIEDENLERLGWYEKGKRISL